MYRTILYMIQDKELENMLDNLTVGMIDRIDEEIDMINQLWGAQ